MKKLFLLIAAALLAVQSGFSAEVKNFTLSECIERALNTSLNLKKSAIDLNTSRISAENLWSQLFPSITVGASFSYRDSFAKDASSSGQSASSGSLTYDVPFSVSLRLDGTLPAVMKLTKLAYNQKLIDWETARRTLRNSVSKQFYQLMIDEENIALLTDTLAITEARLKKDETQFKSGLTSESNYLQSRLNVETARYNLNKAKGDWQTSATAFLSDAGFLNDEIAGKDFHFDGAIEITEYNLDSGALISEYLPKRPDIKKASAAIEQSELTALRTSLSTRGPVVALSGTYSGSILSGDIKTGTSKSFNDNLTAGISVNVPLDSWIPNTNGAQSVSQAKASIEKARLDLADTERQAASSIRTIVQNLENTLSAIKIAGQRLELAERNYKMAETAFERGVMERLAYDDTRASLEQARQSLLTEKYRYKSYTLDLEAALNVDSLDEIE